jgi:endonuclease-8
MPEGDTVHHWAARIRDALAGRPLKRVEIRRDTRGLRPPAPGTRVVDAEARGKHLLVHFDDGAALHTHMMLHGSWQVYRPGARWTRPAHQARVVLEAEDGTTAVCFGAPVVELRRDEARRPPSRPARTLARLGPDLCDPGADLDAAVARFDILSAATTIGEALLDQRVACGVGNVFKSEICWACHVHPAAPVSALTPDGRRALIETAHRQLVANVGGGARRVTYRGGLAVYGKHRRPCPRCRTPICRAWHGADPRVSYWCPTCQPEPEGPGAPVTA